MTATTMRLPPMLSVEETAQNLNVSTKTVRRLIARGELPAHRVGSGLRIRDETLRGCLRRSREEC